MLMANKMAPMHNSLSIIYYGLLCFICLNKWMTSTYPFLVSSTHKIWAQIFLTLISRVWIKKKSEIILYTLQICKCDDLFGFYCKHLQESPKSRMLTKSFEHVAEISNFIGTTIIWLSRLKLEIKFSS